jgi:glycerol-3-phosphate dehydrogenase
MRRDLKRLQTKTFDLLVIGGGIYGACVAWDATLRGLSVALVEKEDFGSGTSANSLKVIHGGLRYLQDGNLPMVRLMSNERSAWLRIAPHLIRPLPFVMPTYRQLTRSRFALGVAMRFNEWLGFDRNRTLHPQRHIPNGRLLSRNEVQQRAGWVDSQATGGALWIDAQMLDSERLLLAFVIAAADRGATVANYVAATRLLLEGNTVKGIEAVDQLTGQPLVVSAHSVVNCAGPWAASVLASTDRSSLGSNRPLSIALNLVTRRLPASCGLGLPSHPAGFQPPAHPIPRTFFLTPWRDKTLIGTLHLTWEGHPGTFRINEALLETFREALNTAYPPAQLKRKDIHHVHFGFLPAARPAAPGENVVLLREGAVQDHQRSDGIANLITVTGVKYSMARHVAEEVVNLVARKRQQSLPASETRQTAVYGGDVVNPEQPPDHVLWGVDAAIMRHLWHAHGTQFKRVLSLITEDPCWAEPIVPGVAVCGAEIINAVREEMACTLTDVVRRRTPLGATGLPEERTLHAVASLMASELGWDDERCRDEIMRAKASYPLHALAETARWAQ